MVASGERPVLAISGGVGGAKLALGLADALAPGRLQVVVNTADDFEHLGLMICPDIDTLLYTLSGRADPERGWGLADESWRAMEALEALGGESWFRLGDRDLATHLWRTGRLRAGAALSEVTAELARRMGVASGVHPMSDDPVRTVVHTDEGSLPFQHYFVRRRCEPRVTGFSFEGLAAARPAPAVVDLLADPGPGAILICPSNPFVSVDPVLRIPGLWQALRDSAAPVFAVSPIVGGRAVKGPAAKMLAELALPVSAAAVARHYQSHYPGLLDGFILDRSDATLADEIADVGLHVVHTDTLMRDRADKRRLADFVLAAAGI